MEQKRSSEIETFGSEMYPSLGGEGFSFLDRTSCWEDLAEREVGIR